MNPDPTYIDVGMLYLMGAGAMIALGVFLTNTARRLSRGGLDAAWRMVRGVLLAIGLWAVCVIVFLTALLSLAWAVGWIVHALNWWPY